MKFDEKLMSDLVKWGAILLGGYYVVTKVLGKQSGDVAKGSGGSLENSMPFVFRGKDLDGKIINGQDKGSTDEFDFVLVNFSDVVRDFSAYVKVYEGGIAYPPISSASSKFVSGKLQPKTWQEFVVTTDGIIGLPFYGNAHLFVNGVEVDSYS